MSRFFMYEDKAVARAQTVIDDLSKKDYCKKQTLETWSFRIPFTDKRGGKITALSISAVKIVEWREPETKVLEIALIGIDDKCAYISELGYDDVRTFEDIDEVIEEIDRLKSLRSV